MAAAAANVVKGLLVRAHSPNTAEQIFKDKVQYKPLHLRPTSPDPTSQDARAHRRLQRVRKCQKASRKRPKPKPLSAKDRRILNVYDIPEELRKYDIYVPLNEMWVKYMWDILGLKEGQQTLVNAGGSGNVLATADYHGAKVTVVRSKCPSLVNLKGIVAKDTKFTFQIITEKNEFKSKPLLVLSVKIWPNSKQLSPSEVMSFHLKYPSRNIVRLQLVMINSLLRRGAI